MEWYHVYPIDDLQEHNAEDHNCWCDPKIDWKLQLIIHNALDDRE